MKRRRRWNLWAGLCALVLALAMVTGAILPPARGVVSGGIIACDALGSSAPHYVPGTVTVLKGQTLVDRQAVDGTYRFDLAPGRYLLEAGISYATVTLSAGDDVHVDIPNMCI